MRFSGWLAGNPDPAGRRWAPEGLDGDDEGGSRRFHY
jgi:hypothetical protein